MNLYENRERNSGKSGCHGKDGFNRSFGAVLCFHLLFIKPKKMHPRMFGGNSLLLIIISDNLLGLSCVELHY